MPGSGAGRWGHAVPTSLFPACASASPRCQPLVRDEGRNCSVAGTSLRRGLEDAGAAGRPPAGGCAGGAARQRRCRRRGCRGSRTAAPAASPPAPAQPEPHPGGKSSPLWAPSPAGELGSPAARVTTKTRRATTAFAWFSENPRRGDVAARCKCRARCIRRLKHQQRFNFLKRLLLLR